VHAQIETLRGKIQEMQGLVNSLEGDERS
jgi:hypothetical protein